MTNIIKPNKIYDTLIKTQLIIYNKNNINQQLGISNCIIDYLFLYNNHCICIYDYYNNNTLSSDNINTYINTINKLSNYLQLKCIGIILLKNKISNELNTYIMIENKKKLNNFIYFYDANLDKMLNKLTEYLYENNIYLYDEDGDCHMLNSKV